MESKICFLILHYQVIEETIKCVDSIMDKINYDNFNIVIVDNGSPNKTGEEIRELYKDTKQVSVIINDKNLGFACGNNIGFKYAKEILKSDFIVMINNDIIMLQEDFCQRILKEYKKSNFSVLGPKILLPNGECDKYKYELKTLKETRKELYMCYIWIFINYIYIYDICSKLKKKILKKQNCKTDNIEKGKRKENCVLQGSCLIFSPNYIRLFDGIDERTFLYKEEQLLYIRIRNNKLLSVYNPDICILHNEGISTKTIKKSNREKNIFVLKNHIKSGKILLKELKKMKKEENKGRKND